MPYSLDWYVTGAVKLQIVSPSRFQYWRIKHALPKPDIISEYTSSMLTLNLTPLSREERTSLVTLCAKTCEALQLKLYNGNMIRVDAEPINRVSPEDIFSPFPCSTGELCLFLDDNIPSSAKRLVQLERPVNFCHLRKSLLEDMYEETGLGKWSITGIQGLKKAHKKRGRKYRSQPSESQVGHRVRYLFTPPVEYGGRLRPFECNDRSQHEGKVELGYGEERMTLNIAVPPNGSMPDGISPGSDHFGQNHDGLLVAIAAGWTEHFWFDPIQQTLMESHIPVTAHVTLDAGEFMRATMRRAYKAEHRKQVEDDGIARYGIVIDSNFARNNAKAATGLILKALTMIDNEPDRRLLELS